MATIVKKYPMTGPVDTPVFIRVLELHDGVVIEACNHDGGHLKDLMHIGPEGVYLYPHVHGIGLAVNGCKHDQLEIRETR